MKGTKLTNPLVSQTFSLPKPLMYYISKNANSAVYFKLYKSCTYFFLQEKRPICHGFFINFDYGNDLVFYDHTIILKSSHLNDMVLKNLTITNTFSIHSRRPTAFLELLPKLHLRIKHLILIFQDFGLTECNFLVSLNLESIQLDKVKIFINKNEIMNAEEIIEKFPTCYSIV